MEQENLGKEKGLHTQRASLLYLFSFFIRFSKVDILYKHGVGLLSALLIGVCLWESDQFSKRIGSVIQEIKRQSINIRMNVNFIGRHRAGRVVQTKKMHLAPSRAPTCMYTYLLCAAASSNTHSVNSTSYPTTFATSVYRCLHPPPQNPPRQLPPPIPRLHNPPTQPPAPPLEDPRNHQAVT